MFISIVNYCRCTFRSTTTVFYKTELERVASFSKWTATTKVSLVRLALKGFLYASRWAEILCIYCNENEIVRRSIETRQNPLDKHNWTMTLRHSDTYDTRRYRTTESWHCSKWNFGPSTTDEGKSSTSWSKFYPSNVTKFMRNSLYRNGRHLTFLNLNCNPAVRFSTTTFYHLLTCWWKSVQ